ncbi:hypothetical protein F511_10402 [Dorcoceras hygrometricum]|uniref:Uncharacterized protein n=1 Tax=Dorcoceras hygrometricum TaxID=472368 RepID=A0A2Z7CC58_9LAMI|nr:hypothetical protein F511_10402 [Dorcoceras hygrometricum]
MWSYGFWGVTRKLSQTFEEVKAENKDLKNSSVEPRSVQLGKTDSLQIELSKLKIENESLRIRSSELESEIEKLNLIMSSWTQSSVSLGKLCKIQKPANDRTGLGFNASESSAGETSTQSYMIYDKFKKMSFVKASMTHDTCESVRRSSKKVKTVWKKVQSRRDLNGQNIKPTLNRYNNISEQTLMDYHTGKIVKVIQNRNEKRNRNSGWNRRRPTARINARGTCALAAHGWAPLLAIVARCCADVRRRVAHGSRPLAARCRPSCRALAARLTRRRPACCAPLAAHLRRWSLDDGRPWITCWTHAKAGHGAICCATIGARCALAVQFAHGVASRLARRRARCLREFCAGGAAGRPPLQRSSGEVVTADFF